MNRTGRVTAAIAALFLSGCGVTLEATRVVPGEAGIKAGRLAPTQVKGEGIVYALPRTEFEVVQPIKLRFSTAGGLRDTYGSCKRACDASPSSVADACDFSTAPSVLFAPPELRTVSVPDYARLYQVTPSADLFQTLAFKFEIASNGVVDKIDATASNTGFEVVSSAASALLKFAGAPAARAAIEAKSRNAGTSRRTCYQVSSDVASLLKQESGALTCSLAKEIETCLTSYEQDVKAEQRAIDDVFDRARGGALKADLVAAIAANRRDRLAAATQRRDEAASLFGLAEGKDVEAVYQAMLSMGGPDEFQLYYAREATLGPTVTDGATRIVAMSDNAGSFLPKLLQPLRQSTRHYVVTSAMPSVFDVLKSDEVTVLGKGYRYRVPVSASTTLTVFKDAGKTAYAFGPATDKKVVAQYGPIAALPSSFKGKSGHVLVKHWPDSGGLQTVEIGAEALPTSAVTDVIDTASEQIKARRDQAAAAAAADPELDALTRQQKLLTLQKQIKDLEAEMAKKEDK
jgi:hypothetical protein